MMLRLHKSTTLMITTIFLHIVSFTDCQPTYTFNSCLDQSNGTVSAGYQSNLAALLSSLSSMASLNNSFYRNESNGIYSLYLCRGDVNSSVCGSCVNSAVQDIQQRCPSNKTAIIWYDQCLLRYSNLNFFGVAETFPWLAMGNTQNTTSPDDINYGALALIYNLISYVPNTEIMFGTNDSATFDGSQHRYALAQCTRDLNSSACKSCLGQLNNIYSNTFPGRVGWRVLAPSCYLRYEEYLFYELPASPSTPVPVAPPPAPDTGGNGGNNATKVAIIAATSSVVLVGALLGIGYYSYSYRKRRRHFVGERSQEILLPYLDGSHSQHSMGTGVHLPDDEDGGDMHFFHLKTIQAATNNFSASNKLGEGGFGPVYQGELPDGGKIAVKRLSMTSKQGLEELRNEVMVIAKLQHKNLVRLLGYCLEGDEKLLVYEYLSNTSLDRFLFDPQKSRELDWQRRANIITGTARGLLYLHEDSRLKIIHRDLKASNILLDDEWNPKISDFGTARIFGGKQIEANTQRVVGTYGYMAPEYALEGLISIKSDVYSFGILMLEIISGKRNKGFFIPDQAPSLLLHAWQLWNEDRGEELIDPIVVGDCLTGEALRWIHIALLCVQDDPAERPTMSTVVLMLGTKSVNLPRPSTAPYSVNRFTATSDQSSTSGTGDGFLSSNQSTTTAPR